VIVRDGVEVGSGYHQKAGTPHAEVHALKQAGELAKGATAYVTLEPCAHFGKTPPCAHALVQAGVSRVVCAMTDPNPLVAGKGLKILENAGIDTRSDVLREQAERVNVGFLKRMRSGTPRLVLKMAASLDGGTALGNGDSQWITGPEARADVQVGRAESCAVVTGVGTVLADNPALNVRLDGYERQPDRVILDTSGRTPVDASIVKNEGKTFIVLGDQILARTVAEYEHAGFKPVLLPTENDRVQLIPFMKWCGEQGYNQLWLECGAILAAAFIQQQLVDEVIYYQAPKFLGSDTRPVMDYSMSSLSEAIEFDVQDVRFVGKDIRWRLKPIFT
jgi:diaminohydroxyphosphoribosylaminopyrimidine deaminase/5-amino-6-(5-phosphoribosylamino)uracil reductase